MFIKHSYIPILYYTYNVLSKWTKRNGIIIIIIIIEHNSIVKYYSAIRYTTQMYKNT